MKVGIIGCGLIGRKRALALQSDDILVACCDINKDIGKKFADEFKCKFYNKYVDLLENSNCDIIIVSVINKYVKDIASYSLKTGNHVLVEKPMGRNADESLIIYNESISNKKIIKVGFNLRFHPAILKAKELLNDIGKLTFIRAHYGHGGRPGMETEWRASKDLCGGGELLDQGVHLIDLSRHFAGEIKNVFGSISTKYWNIQVEDNAFMMLKTKENVDIQLHVSWTNWKNSFQFEIFGNDGYLKINGLGGSYGQETLEFGKRNMKGGIPKIVNFTFENVDNSWNKEWLELKNNIKDFEHTSSLYPVGNGGNFIDGLMANKVIDAIYESSSKNNVVNIEWNSQKNF